MTKRNVVLLLTATISPPQGMPAHKDIDAVKRRVQYEAAIAHYLTAPHPRIRAIALCDNSGADLGSLAAVAEQIKRTEVPLHLHSYSGTVPAEQGKGRSELELIDHAMNAFDYVLSDDAIVWKLTGRHKLMNITEMIETQPRSFSVYADFRHVPLIGDRFGGNRWMDTRAFAFNLAGYNRWMAGKWTEAWFGIEKYFFAEMEPHLKEDKTIVPRFARQPIFVGDSGFSGVGYSTLGHRMKNEIRRATRRFAPGIWL